MKNKISALIDGELDSHERESAVAALRHDPDAIEAWRIYHLVGDVMRDARPLPTGFSDRFSQRLAQEPSILAPVQMTREPGRVRRVPLYAAASLAAIALVGWLAFMPRPGVAPGDLTIAQSRPPTVAKAATEPPAKSLPGSARDYLLAHQAYSPRVTLQGIAPAVRTVADTASERKAK
jgi:sigma-E factor negative regulatory protein RseA